MRFRLISSVAVLTGFGAAALAGAQTASADSQPPPAQCVSGSTCVLQIDNMITWGGSESPGTNNVVVDIAPPPCLWEPIGDAHSGSLSIIQTYGGKNPGPGPYDVGASFTQAQNLLKTSPIPPGEWYVLPINPAAGAAGAAECDKLPLYFFATPGTPLPGIYVPPQTLAQLAFARLDTAGLGTVTLNPRGALDTNLPTFINVQVRNPKAGNLNVAAGRLYVTVTAAIPTQDSVTVWAYVNGVHIDPGALPAHSYPDCVFKGGPQGTYSLGSNYPPAQMNAVGPNQAIDCGVTYTQPGPSTLTVSMDWTACWAQGVTAGPPPAGCAPVPGAGNLQPTQAGVNVNVREVQSVNG